MANRIRRGDKVRVTAGKYKGQEGLIARVLREKNRVEVEGVGVVRRHFKPRQDKRFPEGGIVELPATVHASNVMMLDPKSGQTTRVGVKILADGRRVRIAVKSGEEFPTQGAAAAA